MTGIQSVDLFERERRHLFTVAYGFLGSRTDAEDVVQEAWLRWQRAEQVDKPSAWLATVTARLALDHLRSARVRRETYPGIWLPEPMVSAPSAESAMLSESGLTLAFLFLLERLGPEERAAFVLREAFEQSYREIGDVIGKTETACRQLVKRARDKVRRDGIAPGAVNRVEFEQALGRFLEAIEAGDETKLLEALAADAVLYGDGGGKTPSVLNPIRGRERIVRFVLGLRRRFPNEFRYEPVDVNGAPGLIAFRGEVASIITSYWVSAGKVVRIFHQLNPDKIAAALGEP